MGKSFMQTPGYLQSLATAQTAGEDLGRAQNQQAQDSCILFLLTTSSTLVWTAHSVLNFPYYPWTSSMQKQENTNNYRTYILHLLPASLQIVSCFKKPNQILIFSNLSLKRHGYIQYIQFSSSKNRKGEFVLEPRSVGSTSAWLQRTGVVVNL